MTVNIKSPIFIETEKYRDVAFARWDSNFLVQIQVVWEQFLDDGFDVGIAQHHKMRELRPPLVYEWVDRIKPGLVPVREHAGLRQSICGRRDSRYKRQVRPRLAQLALDLEFDDLKSKFQQLLTYGVDRTVLRSRLEFAVAT